MECVVALQVRTFEVLSLDLGDRVRHCRLRLAAFRAAMAFKGVLCEQHPWEAAAPSRRQASAMR